MVLGCKSRRRVWLVIGLLVQRPELEQILDYGTEFKGATGSSNVEMGGHVVGEDPGLGRHHEAIGATDGLKLGR